MELPKRKSTLRARRGTTATVAPDIRSVLTNFVRRYATAQPIAVQTNPMMYGESE
jgi:hypothetical protein